MLTSKNVQSISPFLIFISISIIIIYYSNKSNRKNYVKQSNKACTAEHRISFMTDPHHIGLGFA